MSDNNKSVSLPVRLFFGFIAGFLATLIFHQLTLALMWSMDFAPYKPFAMTPTYPLGIPAVISLAFWGGIWGISFALIEERFPRGNAYWVLAFLFGGILATLAGFLIVLPLKGQPVGGGWHLPRLLAAFIVNGLWGTGTGLFLKWFIAWAGKSRTAGT